MALTDTELAQVLRDLKYLPPEKVKEAEGKARKDDTSLSEALLQYEFISEDDLGKMLAYHYQLPYVSLSNVNIPDALLQALPKAVAEKFQTIPFELDEDGLHIATMQPDATDVFAMLAKKVGAKHYRISFATEVGINTALRLYKRQLQDVFNDLLAQNTTPPISKIVDTIFEYAFDAHASDVHIEPQAERTIVRFRIDGLLYDMVNLPKGMHEQIASRIKVMARLRTDEHLSAQDGRMQLTIGDEELNARVSIVPIITGEKVVMRLLAKNARRFSMIELGMAESDLDKVWRAFSKPYGMILSTGPTGSGKTTTMYAILKVLNVRSRNIATIEDPVEYEIGGINQIQVNMKTNLTFSAGLRSLLRQDPDVLFVGEIRDEDTASIAVNAAMTGHLVLSTMHTNDAVTTLPRLSEMQVEPFLTASTVNVIVGQRLVRQICEHCRASVEIVKTPQGWKGDATHASLLAGINPKLITKYMGKKTSVRMYHGIGCSACRSTGYQGRIGIFEVLEVTPAMAKLITAKADTDVLLEQAMKDGMTTLMDDGIRKVLSGHTTLAEILRVTKGEV